MEFYCEGQIAAENSTEIQTSEECHGNQHVRHLLPKCDAFDTSDVTLDVNMISMSSTQKIRNILEPFNNHLCSSITAFPLCKVLTIPDCEFQASAEYVIQFLFNKVTRYL